MVKISTVLTMDIRVTRISIVFPTSIVGALYYEFKD